MINVLINAYAVGPTKGSEPGMGWNWIINLAKYCKLHVITEGEWQEEIETYIDAHHLRKKLTFYYLPVSSKIRDMCWNQGDWRFYYYYKKWQKQAYKMSLEICNEVTIDIIHQLNMIGYREPGYLWKIKSTPTIWGPVGGFTTIPFTFLKEFSLKNKCGWVLKNCLNVLQSFLSFRIRTATYNFSQIVGATPIDVKRLNVLCKSKKVIHIPETGSYQVPLKKTEIRQNKKLRIIWIGKFDERKALPLALKAISLVNKTEKIEFNIFGGGNEHKKYVELASKLELIDVCNWYGNVTKMEVHDALRMADLLFFTSIQDATSSVVLEALSFGVPVLCHDANGYGAIIDESCGFKVPFKSPDVSINAFGSILNNLVEHPEILNELSSNASKQSERHSWNEHAKEMIKLYNQLLTNNFQI